MAQGKAIIFCAPSGAGKTTIVRHLVQKIPQLKFSTSATTRERRYEEVDGKDYHFLTRESFEKKVSNDELYEWQEVYPGMFYGTLKSEVAKIWESGNHVIFDVDVIGGINLKKKLGDRALAVFVSVKDVKVLEERLLKRNTETPATLTKRLTKAEEEMSHAQAFDYVLINEQLEDAFLEATELVKDFLK